MTNPTANSTTSVIRNPITSLLPGILVCAIGSSTLHAGVVFTFTEVGSDVVATTSGTIASGWSRDVGGPPESTTAGSFVAPDALRGTTSDGIYYTSSGTLWTNTNPLTGVPLNGSGVTSGDTFGYGGTLALFVPSGTAAGDAITPNTTITWANETFASLGLDTALSTTPLVLFTLDNNETISAVLGNVSAVPGAGLAGLATVGLAGVSRRRRR